MEQNTLQKHLTTWLGNNYAADQHITILNHVLTVGKASKPWVDTIQRYVREHAWQTPERGEIKRACRALVNRAKT